MLARVCPNMTSSQQTWRWSIAAIGLALFGLTLLQFIVDDGSGLINTLEIVVPIVLSGVLFWYGVRLALDAEFETYRRVLAWCIFGGGILTVLGIWTFYLQVLKGAAIDESLYLVLGDATVGAVVGTLVGRYEAGQQHQRREAEAARESAEEYREIFEKVDEGIAIWHPETGGIIDVNPYYAEMTGYEREEIRGLGSEEITADVPEFDPAEVMERIGLALEGEPQTFDWPLKTADGNQLWTEVSLKAATVGEEDRLIAVVRDITDRERRKQQLAELHEASRRLAYATSRAEVAETTVEIARDVLEMPVSTLWRYEQDRDCLVPVVMTDSSKDILDVDSIDELDPITDDELGMEVFRSGEIWSTDDYGTVDNAAFDIPFGNVILVPLDDQGLLEVGQLEVEDPTDEMLQRAGILGLNASAALDRIDRERELERAQERFRALSENSPVGIVTIDDSSTVQFANPAMGDMLGYGVEDVIGESITSIIPERLREKHRDGIQRYLDTGERNLDWSGIELPARHADGHEIDVEVSFGELGWRKPTCLPASSGTSPSANSRNNRFERSRRPPSSWRTRRRFRRFTRWPSTSRAISWTARSRSSGRSIRTGRCSFRRRLQTQSTSSPPSTASTARLSTRKAPWRCRRSNPARRLSPTSIRPSRAGPISRSGQ